MGQPALDFSAIFAAVPTPLLVLDVDASRFTIVAANDAYLDATMTNREDIRGRGLFEVFPDNPADPTAPGTRSLAASLERVRARRASDLMPVLRYDIPRRGSVARGFEERHWAPHNSPVLSDGKVSHILHRVEDVTSLVRAGNDAGRSKPPLAGRHTLHLCARTNLPMLRDAIRDASVLPGLGEGAVMDLLVAATELATNMLVHAGGGTVEVEHLGVAAPMGVRLRFRDEGPGIRHLDHALAGGFSTRGTLGLGLSGARNLVDDFDVDTGSHGTTVTVTKWKRPTNPRTAAMQQRPTWRPKGRAPR